MRKDPVSYARECYCRNLRHVASQTVKLYDRYLKEADITIQQFSLLEHIHSMEPVSVTELSRYMDLNHTSLSRNLKVLKSNAFIEDGERRGRSRQIVLSEHGKKTLLKAEELWEKAQAEFESRLDVEDLRLLKRMLFLLSDRL